MALVRSVLAHQSEIRIKSPNGGALSCNRPESCCTSPYSYSYCTVLYCALPYIGPGCSPRIRRPREFCPLRPARTPGGGPRRTAQSRGPRRKQTLGPPAAAVVLPSGTGDHVLRASRALSNRSKATATAGTRRPTPCDAAYNAPSQVRVNRNKSGGGDARWGDDK